MVKETFHFIILQTNWVWNVTFERSLNILKRFQNVPWCIMFLCERYSL